MEDVKPSYVSDISTSTNTHVRMKVLGRVRGRKGGAIRFDTVLDRHVERNLLLKFGCKPHTQSLTPIHFASEISGCCGQREVSIMLPNSVGSVSLVDFHFKYTMEVPKGRAVYKYTKRPKGIEVRPKYTIFPFVQFF